MINLQVDFARMAGVKTALEAQESASNTDIGEAENLTLEMNDNPLKAFLRHIDFIADLDKWAALSLAMTARDEGAFLNFDISKLEDKINDLLSDLEMHGPEPTPKTDPTWEESEPTAPIIRPQANLTPNGFA